MASICLSREALSDSTDLSIAFRSRNAGSSIRMADKVYQIRTAIVYLTHPLVIGLQHAAEVSCEVAGSYPTSAFGIRGSTSMDRSATGLDRQGRQLIERLEQSPP